MPHIMVQMPQTEKQIPDSYSATIIPIEAQFQEKKLCFWGGPTLRKECPITITISALTWGPGISEKEGDFFNSRNFYGGFFCRRNFLVTSKFPIRLIFFAYGMVAIGAAWRKIFEIMTVAIHFQSHFFNPQDSPIHPPTSKYD